MIARVIMTAVIAGLVGGGVVSGVQALSVAPLIHEAETYETQAAESAAQGRARTDGAGEAHVDEGAAWAPADGRERTLYTVLANVLVGIGFAALLAAGFVLSGREVTLAQSVVWGAGGFLAFGFLPAIGLPPELPGSVAADLGARQGWWLASALANCIGLALIFFARRAHWKLLGGLAIFAPILVGAPHPTGGGAGALPPELSARFVTASLATSLVFWLALAVSAAFVYRRVSPAGADGAGEGQAA